MQEIRTQYCALSFAALKLCTVVDKHETLHKNVGCNSFKSNMADKIQNGRHNSQFYKQNYSNCVHQNKSMNIDQIVSNYIKLQISIINTQIK